ncbi:zinc finger protein 436 [Drosophila guanche]|uniref:Blast:Zinc finger protein 271 n=1 Tax=Drosophila guanche TaxID=7266 RepID=A0A3B0JZQ4_DROGU|nr:zinc finger protein 436 [Drosophila guanche]SPP85902.1 blast:Zinc finger protein 271 [Drosophila guanche]
MYIMQNEAKRSAPNERQESASSCRLCHRPASTETTPNIFTDREGFWDGDKFCIADVCQSVWGVQYDRHEYLPEQICSDCLEVLEDFYKQRRGMKAREAALQEQLKEVIKKDPKYRPGLNGNPGEFEPGDDCEIEEVDPDKLAETSDDEMGSDEENENAEDEEEEEEFEDGDEDEADTTIADDADIPLGTNAEQMAEMSVNMELQQPSVEFNSGGARPKTAFLCQYCDLGYTLPIECQKHERTAHDPQAPYCCTFCSLLFVTRATLITHIKSLHDMDRPYVCAQCGKGFVRRSDLKKHAIVHTGVRPYTCNVCTKSFSRNTNLTKHMRIHSGEKPFVCQQCPRSFQTAQEMTNHSRLHSGARPFQCNRCPFSSSRKDKLVAHHQMHTKRDVEEILMQQHQNTLHPPTPEQLAQLQHELTQQLTPKPITSQKPGRSFRCDVCDRVFQRERDLQRHRALHLDTLLACKICNLVFNRREQLQRHTLEAHGPTYTCAICCITFLQQIELENHLKVHQLQHKVAQSTQQAMIAAAIMPHKMAEPTAVAKMPPVPQVPLQVRPSAAELNFYSNMVPTMNLGFYSETRPEE